MFLPKNYKVMASMGHIRDLPQSASDIPEKYKKESWASLGVDIENNFEPVYVIPKDKKAVVKELRKAVKEVGELILATDEDREGESISWHLLEVLKLKIPVKRMVFHEITKSAISASLKNCREINLSLAKAQETRRILDRLYGYTLSPLLWKKIAAGLSAGRVQSVSVLMIVVREKERRAFRQGKYWDIKALLEKDEKQFESRLISVDDKRIASGSDFDEKTGEIPAEKNVVLLDDGKVDALRKKIDGKDFKTLLVKEKKVLKRPAPPFITSTLQQDANRKLKLAPRQTMRVAQSLYERGFITYMRTDSMQLSEQAIKAARKSVSAIYGKEYLSNGVRRFQGKSKGAQEAHEAIRPAGSSFRHPKDTGLSGMELSLYDMIWKRTIATQMADARQISIKALFQVENAIFQSNGKRMEFPGFFRAYVEGSDDPKRMLESREVILPEMSPEEMVKCLKTDALEHETAPPHRYTSASLIKKLEAEGIGRPSTYATIIDTIINRGYAKLVSNSLVPSFTAFAVTALMEKHFSDLVDMKFTSRMEDVLDEIAAGEADQLPYMKKFFMGEDFQLACFLRLFYLFIMTLFDGCFILCDNKNN